MVSLHGFSFALLGLIGGAIVLFIIAFRFVHQRSARRFFSAAIVFLVASALAVVGLGMPIWVDIAPDDPVVIITEQVVSVLWWLALASLSIRGADLFLWRGVFRSQHIPKLLKDVVGALFYLIALFAIVALVFDQPVTGLLATSGVVAVVLGFALQNTLGDVFSGIALNMEHPYRQGDWIQLDNGFEGEVVEINWRATHLRSRDDTEIVQPNSSMATARIVNYHYPTTQYAFNVKLRLDYKLPPSRAKAILMAAALACDNVKSDPAPISRVWDFEESTVLYDVKVWVEDFALHPNHVDMVYSKIWEHLRWAGVDVAFPQRDIHMYESFERDQTASLAIGELLQRTDLFAPLEGDELASLAERTNMLQLRPGRQVVQQGEDGSSLYIIAEGLLEVRVKFDDGRESKVATVGPGDFFGEMSLLTGIPRSATVITMTDAVIYEIDKEQIEPILKARPETADVLAAYLTRRREATKAFADNTQSVSADQRAAAGYTDQLVSRIRTFFQL
ncbi:MAG: mechanosensitive ion channel [Rhodospirillaceae bacterium]|nr:mechanosensitive ion channel [Rhodospirillaceae bacterium]MBT5666009.1 mechanosensitive ion channel [Rhodospirillaceae bacterium]